MVNGLKGSPIQESKVEILKEMEVIKNAGGNIKFLFAYHKYLGDLRAGNRDTIANTGKHFLKRPLQIAAVGAIKHLATLKVRKDDLSDFDEQLLGHLEPAAHAAYVNAAGHHEEQALAHLPQDSPEATNRRQKAENDWDTFAKNDLERLMHISVWGSEPRKTQSITLIEHIQGIGSIILVVIISVTAYYLWKNK